MNKPVCGTTVEPSARLVENCRENIESGLRTLIICPSPKLAETTGYVVLAELYNQIEIFTAETLISMNLNRQGLFYNKTVHANMVELIAIYNAKIESQRLEPSLKISLN